MSTRGCIAFGTPSSWEGLYNHWDNYPTGRGPDVWQEIQKHKTELVTWRKEVLSYDEWQSYKNKNVCPFCGKLAGTPHSYGGSLYEKYDDPWTERFVGENVEQKIREYWMTMPWAHELGRAKDVERMIAGDLAIARNLQKCGFPDPECKNHQHSNITTTQAIKKAHITSAQAKDQALWIEYVYVVDVEARKLHVLASHAGPKEYSWRVLKTYVIDDAEPNWATCKEGANEG